MCIYLLILLVLTSVAHADYELSKAEFDSSQSLVDGDKLQLNIIKNFLSPESRSTLAQWIEFMQDKTYEDFDQRIGICWDDYWFNRSTGAVLVDSVKKYIFMNGKNVEQKPASIFSYSKVSHILLHEILPIYFDAIRIYTPLPETVYLQTFILRSVFTPDFAKKRQLVRWHQDPSEYVAVADYTLVLMLSNPFDDAYGWDGGELLIKNGLPTEDRPAIKVTPYENQAVLFNNTLNSHMVTTVKPYGNDGVRDIMIINIYLTDPTQ